MPIENETVDAGIDDEAIEVKHLPMLLQSDVGRPSRKSNVMLHQDTPSIELGVTHAWEHVESLEDMFSLLLVPFLIPFRVFLFVSVCSY